jgi:hypothetical protein
MSWLNFAKSLMFVGVKCSRLYTKCRVMLNVLSNVDVCAMA